VTSKTGRWEDLPQELHFGQDSAISRAIREHLEGIQPRKTSIRIRFRWNHQRYRERGHSWIRPMRFKRSGARWGRPHGHPGTNEKRRRWRPYMPSICLPGSR